MKVAIVTNIRAPYRKLQIEEFCKIPNIEISVYYTDKNFLGRNWNVDKINGAKEVILKGSKLTKYGYINFGLINVVKDNDVIIIGGYEQPSYILLSLICRLYRKPYIIISDGISPKKIYEFENPIKFFIKSKVIRHASAIFGNGTVSKLYFTQKFGYDCSKIFNQYLTVDIRKIIDLDREREQLRKMILDKLRVKKDKKVLIYSGRLIKRKNVDSIIKAINNLKTKEDYVLLILGGGEEEKNLLNLANDLGVDIRITGFIPDQDELFKHYYAGDVLILPSYNEPWGLVVNEALAAGLPVIVSNECGCSLDLVKNGENGYIVHPGNVYDISKAIENICSKGVYYKFKIKAREVVKEWNFENSRKSFETMLNFIAYKK